MHQSGVAGRGVVGQVVPDEAPEAGTCCGRASFVLSPVETGADRQHSTEAAQVVGEERADLVAGAQIKAGAVVHRLTGFRTDGRIEGWVLCDELGWGLAELVGLH